MKTTIYTHLNLRKQEQEVSVLKQQRHMLKLKIIGYRDYIMTSLTKCQSNIFQTLSTVLYVHILSVKYLTFSLDSPYVPIHLKEFGIEYRIIIWHRKCSSNKYILIFLRMKSVLLFYLLKNKCTYTKWDFVYLHVTLFSSFKYMW